MQTLFPPPPAALRVPLPSFPSLPPPRGGPPHPLTPCLPRALPAPRQAVVYITGTPSTSQIDNAQRQLLQLLDVYKIRVATVDCAEPANKDARNAAWALSGKRAVYPQLFTRAADGTLAFVGDWDAVQALSESNEDLHGLDKALEGLARK